MRKYLVEGLDGGTKYSKIVSDMLYVVSCDLYSGPRPHSRERRLTTLEGISN